MGWLERPSRGLLVWMGFCVLVHTLFLQSETLKTCNRTSFPSFRLPDFTGCIFGQRCRIKSLRYESGLNSRGGGWRARGEGGGWDSLEGVGEGGGGGERSWRPGMSWLTCKDLFTSILLSAFAHRKFFWTTRSEGYDWMVKNRDWVIWRSPSFKTD